MSIEFGEVEKEVRIKILSSNSTDVSLQTDSRFGGKVIQPGRTTATAIAEHGLAMSIEVNGINILYDFGGMTFAILKNLEIFQMNPSIFQKAVLSHGHVDHFGTLLKLLPLLGEGKKLIVSPHIYNQKIMFMGEEGESVEPKTLSENYRLFKKQGKVSELPIIKKSNLEKLTSENGQVLIETSEPLELSPGVWTSGTINIIDESELTSNLFIKMDKTNFEADKFQDEIAIYINVKNKGLIVLTGCGHTGIINIIKHAQNISGIDRIYAVIGGFHLNWSSEDQLNKAVSYFEEIRPEIICGMHCTGFKFNMKLYERLPLNMTVGIVGTSFIL